MFILSLLILNGNGYTLVTRELDVLLTQYKQDKYESVGCIGIQREGLRFTLKHY